MLNIKKNDHLFCKCKSIVPPKITRNMSIPDIINFMGETCFEARNVFKGSELFKRMIDDNDTIWLGIAGAGIAGGMGGAVISLIEMGFIDAICVTGAQVYHDLHFAFNLPVKAINPSCNDQVLKENGITRIYDIGIKSFETLEAQDNILRRFVIENEKFFASGPISSCDFNYCLGMWVNHEAPAPEKSFTAVAAKKGIPIFWDSLANHSIALNFARNEIEGINVTLSAQKDIFESAAIVYQSDSVGFVELGGGGPKNFIQQTGPFLSQIMGVKFNGADRGLQIGTAIERDGSLSGCTFNEAITWGKFSTQEEIDLVQIWGDYTVIFPLICGYVIDICAMREQKKLLINLPELTKELKFVINNKYGMYNNV